MEAPGAVGAGPGAARLGPSRGIVLRLAGLFAVDALGGGFAVQSLLALWFHERYDLDLGALGGLFLAANIASAVSLLAAPRLARRFGLLNTMVFTHLPSNALLMLVPLMPNAALAIAALAGAANAGADGRSDATGVHYAGRDPRGAHRGGGGHLNRAVGRVGGGAGAGGAGAAGGARWRSGCPFCWPGA